MIWISITLLAALDIYIILAFFRTIKQDIKLRTKIFFLLSPLFVIVTSYLILFFVSKENFARFFYNLITISIVWFMMAFGQFLISLSHYLNTLELSKKNLSKLFNLTQHKLPYLFISFDTIFVMMDMVFNHLFGLQSITGYNGIIHFWSMQYSRLFIIHLIIYSFFILNLIAITIRRIATTPALFRRIYILLLIFFGVLVFLNFVFLYIKFYFDLTILMYPLMGLSFWYYSIRYLAKDHQDLMLSIIAEDFTSPVACFDFDKNCIYKNSAAIKLFEKTNNPYHNIENYLTQSWLSEFFGKNTESISGDDSFMVNGEERNFYVEYASLVDSKKHSLGYFIKLDDKTEQVNKFKLAKYKATYDELTGLYNKNTFFEKVEELLKADPETPRYMVVTNIMNFKLLNDLFGTQLGDTVLKIQSQMLQKAKYKDVIFGRISADNYAMLIGTNDFNPVLAGQNTSRIQHITQSLNYKLKVYIGVYEITSPTESPVSMCDKALLAIKKIYGDLEQTVAFYDSSIMDEIVKHKTILSDFSKSFRNNEFNVLFEPFTDKDNNCVGAQTSLCWEHPVLGALGPEYYIPTLESTNYIYTIDYFIWEKAFIQLKKWQETGHSNLYMAITISTKDFLYADLYIALTDLAEKYEISVEKMILQVEEGVLKDNFATNQEVLLSLKRYGFTIIISEFGSGNSSLCVLQELELDGICFNAKIIESSKNSERTKKLINSMSELMLDLNFNMTVKNVTSKELLNDFAKMGFTNFHGYYYNKPLTIEEFDKIIFGGNNE